MTTTVASPPEVRAPVHQGRRTLGDRLNPILVKEVRQALRGKYFRALFTITLTFATLMGLVVVARGSQIQVESLGVGFSMIMLGCMAAAVHAFTPFWAFLSTSGEWDENTHDLLVLSNLRPRQIVAGKLLSALAQALLYYSTFGPFLVFAFLLNGVDLLSVSVILVCSLALCVALSLIGIALASLARTRAARGLLMAVFGGGLGIAWFATVGMGAALIQEPQILRDTEGRIGVLTLLTLATIVGGFFAAVALARFAHEEENRSSGLRVFSVVIVLLGGVWGWWLTHETGSWEPAFVVQLATGALLLIPWLGFLTEPERLGRRAHKHVAKRDWVALLSIPFLPGGGRGMLLFALHFGLALLCTRIALGSAPVPVFLGTRNAELAYGTVALFYGYALLFIGLPAAVGAWFLRSARARWALRLAILVAIPLVVLAPALLGLLLGFPTWIELEHPLNPFWVLSRLGRTGGDEGVLVLTVGVLVTLVCNAPRVIDGVREVLGASRAARASARARAGAE